MYGIAPAPEYINKDNADLESAELSRQHHALIKMFRSEIKDNGKQANIHEHMCAAGLTPWDIKYVRKSANNALDHCAQNRLATRLMS